MFRLLTIDVHGMKKRSAKISFLLTKSKNEIEKGLKCATPKIVPTQAAAWFPCFSDIPAHIRPPCIQKIEALASSRTFIPIYHTTWPLQCV
jgi:hypothetical protein